jgi:hypothetical protein
MAQAHEAINTEFEELGKMTDALGRNIVGFLGRDSDEFTRFMCEIIPEFNEVSNLFFELSENQDGLTTVVANSLQEFRGTVEAMTEELEEELGVVFE